MKQRTALLIAAALTAFVLVIAGSLALSISQRSLGKAISPDGAAAEPVSAQVAPARVQQPAPALAPAQAGGAAGAVQAKLITADRASQVALKLLTGATLQKAPELVNYKGRMAYEVMLSAGTVYVDAFSGKVLGTVVAVASNPAVSNSDSAPPDNGGSSVADPVSNTDPVVDPGAQTDPGAQVQATGGEPADQNSHDGQEPGDHKGDGHKDRGGHDQHESPEGHDD